ncbi:bola-like protein [Linderina pennispora]|uniref:Bola-like protein n=1 Tax=Linderina pennispora TaxID=61395 RepID=A0A1Y1WF97_9FUNG|nr:bola-like protein [Linderina pennispora]ORX71834.1 bola-like protein [Linderina pennispora]
MTTAPGPLEQLIRQRIEAAYAPTVLEIENESHKHRHHAPMQGVTSTETHFKIKVVSSQFAGQRLLQRQRSIYSLFKHEMAMDGGIHAMALVTRTPEEEQK